MQSLKLVAQQSNLQLVGSGDVKVNSNTSA